MLSTLATVLATSAFTQPNIVLIVADDLGYSDVGCYGSSDIKTPNIDAIGARGVRFTDGYVASPMCGPSRAGLLTGRMPTRFGFEFNLPLDRAKKEDIGLPATEATIAEKLKTLGYSTGIVGKWHLGMRPRFKPNDRGFDRFFGFLQGQSGYLPGGTTPISTIYDNNKRVKIDQYLTDVFSQQAVSFIDSEANKGPFFLYVAYNAPHKPLQATAKYLDRYPNLQDPRRKIAAMISAVDDGIGSIYRALGRNKVANRTIFVFLSDNGGVKANGSTNSPLRGEKHSMFEGGIRVPYLISWPARLPQGQTYTYPVSAIDLAPTFHAAAEGHPSDREAMEGKNLLPYLTGRKTDPPHTSLAWRYGERRAMRSAASKYVRRPINGIFYDQLYDLAHDVSETTELSADYPEKLGTHIRQWQYWDTMNVDPLWEEPLPTGSTSP